MEKRIAEYLIYDWGLSIANAISNGEKKSLRKIVAKPFIRTKPKVLIK